ncbi:MAG: DUF1080 domain-containing protein [Saprospiraceae bacterium]|nr:DUF1080 domain-containing protein [Saprospiraceae bacterium]
MLRYVIFFTWPLLLLGIGCGNQTNSDDATTSTKIVRDGWEGNAKYFRSENDVIFAGDLTESIPSNEFFCTEKIYGDFEMTLQAKLTGEGKNAGIQFRSTRIPNHHEVIGYQCDMGNMEDRYIWGSLYDESRRKTFLVHPPADSVSQILNPDGWNDFRIRVEGHHIQIWLNDFQTVDYIESDSSIATSGIICLQIHSGPPALAQYRGIVIREL